MLPYMIVLSVSLPAWECGLKLALVIMATLTLLVTPCVGVWIEIMLCMLLSVSLKSLPAWECGLKYRAKK